MLENCHHVRGGNKSDRLYVVAGVHIKFDPTAELGLGSYKFRNFASKKRIFMMSLDPEGFKSEVKSSFGYFKSYIFYFLYVWYEVTRRGETSALLCDITFYTTYIQTDSLL